MAYNIYSKAGTDEAISSALADSLPTTPADIGAATAAQGALADTAVQPEDLGTAAAADAGDFATAAQGAKADASDVDQITLTGDLVLTLPVGHPAGQVYRAAITQDGVGGHTVTYGGEPVAVDLMAGASTTVELMPVGAGYVVRYPASGPTSGTNTGDQVLPTWTTLSGKPAVIAAGATQADARTAIGAGTSSLVIGTGAGDAKAGNYTPDLSGLAVKSANLSDIANAATARANLSAQRAHMIDARDYGATGDGVTDDAAALQAAIDYCAASKFGLHIPAGTYIISVPLNLKSNTRVTGAGIGNTIIKKVAASTNARGVDAVIAAYQASYWSLSGLSVRGNRTRYAEGNTVTTDGLHLSNCGYFSVADVKVDDCSTGFTTRSCYTCSYDRLTAMRCQGYAFTGANSSTSSIWSNCTSWGCGGGFKLVSCIYTTIIAPANDHCCAGGKADDPFLPEGSGGSYTAPGYAFELVGSPTVIISPGIENGYCKYLYAEGANATFINPYMYNIKGYASTFRLIELRGTAKSSVRFINPYGFDSAINAHASGVSNTRVGVYVENPDRQWFRTDKPLDIGSTFGAYAYVGGYTSEEPSGARTAAPTAGTWSRLGQRFENYEPLPGEYMGWVLTAVGTLGTLNGGATTGSITSGTAELTVSSATGLAVNNYITVAGVAGVKKVTAINGTTVTINSNANATVTAAAVAYSPPTWKGYGLIES